MLDVYIPKLCKNLILTLMSRIEAAEIFPNFRVSILDLVNLLEAMDQRDRFIVMVGGASVTPDYTAHIKADGTAPNAMDAVKEARRLMRTKRESGGDG